MQHVTDAFGDPGTDGIAPAHEVVRVVRMQAFHAIERTSADTSTAFEAMQCVPPRDVITLRVGVLRGEGLVRSQSIGQLSQMSGRLEVTDLAASAHTRQPEERRKRRAVHDRKRLDHSRMPAPAPHRDAYVAAKPPAELSLDGGAIVGIEPESGG